MPEPLNFIPLDEWAARPRPQPPKPPPIPTWKTQTQDERFQKADTARRLQLLDNWVQVVNEHRDEIPGFDPAYHYDRAQAERAAITASETSGEWAKKTAKTLPGSLLDSLLGLAMFAGEHMDMTPIIEGRKRETPVTDAMAGNIVTFVEGKVTNDSQETKALQQMTAEFRDAVGREQFPKHPDEARKWFAGWETKLREQSKKAYPQIVPGTEIDGDVLSRRRSLTDYEPNLQGIAAFISTKNPAYISPVLDRVTGSAGRAVTRQMIEAETKGMPEWKQRAFEAGADPVNVVMTAASLGVGAAVAAPIKAGTSAVKAALLRTGAVVADAELNAMGERVSSWLQNGQASDEELDEAAKQGRFAAYLFAGLGYTGRKVLSRKQPETSPPSPDVAKPASLDDLPTVADDSPAPTRLPAEARQGEGGPGSAPVDLPGARPPGERMLLGLESQPQAGPLNAAAPARPDAGVMPRTLDPVPESPATLEAQADRAAAGKRYAVLITKGEEVPGNMPERFQSVDVAEGKVFYDPQVFDADGIKEAADNNQLGEVLGYGVPNKAANADRAVVQRDANGTEVAAVAANPEQVPAATAALESASLPGDTVAVEPLAKVVQERLAAEDSPAPPKKKTPPRPGIPWLEQGTEDVWNFLQANPIRIPRPKEKAQMRKRGVGVDGNNYDINWTEGVPPRFMVAFSQEGRAPDLVALDAHALGIIPEPDVKLLKAKMDEALSNRFKTAKEADAQERRFKAIERFTNDARPQKGRVTVDPRTLDIGDEVVLANGKKMTVDHIDRNAIYFDGKEAYGGEQVQWGLDSHFGAARVTRTKRAPGINKDRSPEAQAARFMEAARSDQGGKLPVPVQALQVGDTITIDGTPSKVVAVEYNDFTGVADGVTIEDGRRFGVQRLADGSVIYAEKVDRPKGTPKLNQWRAESAAADLAAETQRSGIEAPKPLAKLLEAEDAPVARIDEGEPRQAFDEDGYDLPPEAEARRASTGGEAVEAGAKAAARGAGASVGPGASSAAEWAPHKATLRLANDERLSARTRELLQEGQDYRILGRAENLEEARALIEREGGLLAATRVMDDPEIPGRVKVVVAEAAIRRLDADRAKAKSKGEIEALDDLIDEVARKLNRVNLEAGRTVEANKHISMLTPESILSELAERVETRIEQGRVSPLAEAIPPRPDGKPLAAEDIVKAMPKELQTRVRDLTAKIRNAPQGIFQADLKRQLLAEIARWEGVDLLSLGEEYWMANLLSGLNTQGVNVWGNGTNLMLRTLIAALRERDFATVGQMFNGMAKGAKEGGRDFIRAWQGKDIVKWQEKYGMHESALENFSAMFDGRTDLKARAARAFTLGKYIFRALGGMDAFFWRTAYEGRVTLAAARHARSVNPKLQGSNLAHYLSEVLHNGQSETAAALVQAAKEAADLGLTVTKRDIEARAWEILDSRRPDAIRTEGRRYADLLTYTNKPEGSMGVVAALLNNAVEWLQTNTPLGPLRPAKYVFPFVNTIANVASSLMDFTPVGVWRGLTGRHIFGKDPVKFSAIEAGERLYAGVMGTTVAGLAYALAGAGDDPDDPTFEVYGEGPTDPEKRRQMRNAGWTPFSIMIGNNFYSYKESPLGLALAVVGGVRDLENFSGKYSTEDAMARTFYVLGTVPNAISQQGVLQGLEGLSGLLSGQPGKLRRFAEGTAKGFIPGVGLMRDIGRVFDTTVVDSKTLHGAILKDVPVIRRELNEPALNAFGEPVRVTGLGRIPVVSRIASSRVVDKDIEFLAEHGLWLPGHAEIVNVGAGLETKGERQYIARLVENRAQKMGRMQAGILTDAETRDYLRRQGVWLRQGLQWMRQRKANGIGAKDKEGMQEEVNRISRIARQAAMRDMLGLPQRLPQRSKR